MSSPSVGELRRQLEFLRNDIQLALQSPDKISDSHFEAILTNDEQVLTNLKHIHASPGKFDPIRLALEKLLTKEAIEQAGALTAALTAIETLHKQYLGGSISDDTPLQEIKVHEIDQDTKGGH